MSETATTPIIEIEQQTRTALYQAHTIQVTDQASLEVAAASRARLKRILAGIDQVFRPMQRRSDEAKAMILAQRRTLEEPAKAAILQHDQQIAAYLDAERIRRQQAEAILSETARQQAETARVDLAAAVEPGDPAAAAAILSVPAVPTPVILPPVEADGISIREDWTYVIENPDLVPRDYLAVDTVKIGKVVRAMRGQTHIPGIRIYSKTVVVGRP